MNTLRIGWAQVDLTPVKQPVLISGQFYSRLSEGVLDPITATICVMEREGEQLVWVSCDLVSISRELLAAVRERLKTVPIDPMKVVMNATHTHAGPEIRYANSLTEDSAFVASSGVELGECPVVEYVAYAADQISRGILQAWNARQPGGIAYGLDYAVVGRNRRWVDRNGKAYMYGLKGTAVEEFSHFEGYEDHSLNLLATYDTKGKVTGLMVNLPCPSQLEEHLFQLSADFWHETRRELRARFGEGLYILPQVSTAGDLSPHLLYEQEAHARMVKLRGRTQREERANRIADAVGRILPYLGETIEYAPILHHQVEQLEIPANRLTQADADEAEQNARQCHDAFLAEKERLEAHPELKSEPRWYKTITMYYRRMKWHRGVVERFQRGVHSYTEEIHLVRLGDIAFATNPYEYYLDYGIQIKLRSPAIQTFVVQLAGPGTYVPSERSTRGGGYGSVPASNPVGSEGGKALAEATIRGLRELWPC